MPNVHPILADSSALIGLAAIEAEYAELVFSTVGITTTYTCFKEIRDLSRDADDQWTQRAATRVIDFIEDGTIDYPNRVPIPSAPVARRFNAGEKSLQIAVKQYDSVTDILLYDSDAWHVLQGLQEELADTARSFNLEPPNLPLYIMAANDSVAFSEDEFCKQTDTMIKRRGWDGSLQEELFWDYPIDC